MHKEIIFLDFDGVLHPKMYGNFELMRNFTRVLDVFPSVHIVISSNWKDELNQSNINEIFGQYAHRVIGKTPNLPDMKRQDEINSYVAMNHVQLFIAIDDDCRNELFYNNCYYLFKTNYFKGLTKEKSDELIQYMISKGFKSI